MKAELNIDTKDEQAKFIAVPGGKEVFIEMKDSIQLIVMNVNVKQLYEMRAYLNYVIEMYK